jgi:sec-independent protein translocase protein TatA
MFGIGSTELLVFFLILLILFGGSKLPQLGRGLGSFIQEFKSSVAKGKEDPEKPDDNDKNKNA